MMEEFKDIVDDLYDEVVKPLREYKATTDPDLRFTHEYSNHYRDVIEELDRQFDIELGKLLKTYPFKRQEISKYMLGKVSQAREDYRPK